MVPTESPANGIWFHLDVYLEPRAHEMSTK